MIDGAQRARSLDRFGENLTVLRHRSGLVQTEVAIRAGIHRTEVSLLERRLRMPTLGTIVRLAGAVEVEPAQLLEGLAWSIDPVRAVPEMEAVGGRRSVWVAGGWVRVR
ncbi:MAG: helix-turn-helix transcriptional regulator [Actinobacteria bacterium]|nr:helix-turn-helix transcriptional regulator [Actinomycetota bacterium]